MTKRKVCDSFFAVTFSYLVAFEEVSAIKESTSACIGKVECRKPADVELRN